MSKIPEKFHNLFWDVEVCGLCPETHKNFIIGRILEKGNFDSVKWLFSAYNLKTISDTITQSPNLSNPTISFWKQILNF